MTRHVESLAISPIRSCVALSRPPSLSLAATAIGFTGELIRLWVPQDSVGLVFGRSTDRPDLPSFPKTHAKHAYAATVTVTTPHWENNYDLPELTTTFPMVALLPDERILIVGARCTRHPDGTAEQNASIFKADGSLESKFCLGDGIEHVQIDESGNIWVGYFDEGVYGNFGWGINETLGGAGLVCFDDRGQAQWKFEPLESIGPIDDCYALNVGEDGVWTCYYSDFPITYVDKQHRMNAWTTDLSGPRAIAVSRDLILAYGGYSDHRTDCSLLSLNGQKAISVAHVKFMLPPGFDLEAATVIGRGSFLHVVSGDQWHTFRVPEKSALLQRLPSWRV